MEQGSKGARRAFPAFWDQWGVAWLEGDSVLGGVVVLMAVGSWGVYAFVCVVVYDYVFFGHRMN